MIRVSAWLLRRVAGQPSSTQKLRASTGAQTLAAYWFPNCRHDEHPYYDRDSVARCLHRSQRHQQRCRESGGLACVKEEGCSRGDHNRQNRRPQHVRGAPLYRELRRHCLGDHGNRPAFRLPLCWLRVAFAAPANICARRFSAPSLHTVNTPRGVASFELQWHTANQRHDL